MTARLSGALAAPVMDRASAEAWLTALVDHGLDFHLDDVGDDEIVSIRTGKPIFHPDDMPLVRSQVAACNREDWGDSCPIGFMLERARKMIAPDDEDEGEYEPGDGCLACGRLSCDCDQRYDESREDD